MSISYEISSVSLHELDALLDRANTERWSQLTLIGPLSNLRLFKELPEKIRQSENVFWLTEPVEGIATKVQALTNLTWLILTGYDIGDAGARAVAALSNLTSLDLAGNGIGAEGAMHPIHEARLN